MPKNEYAGVDLAAIEARANAATPGPWRFPYGRRECRVIDDGGRYIAETGLPGLNGADDDAEFIAHARTDVDALVAAVRERDTQIEGYQRVHGPCTCGPWHPDMDGPKETCPQHGRSVEDWIARADQMQAERDQARDSLAERADTHQALALLTAARDQAVAAIERVEQLIASSEANDGPYRRIVHTVAIRAALDGDDR
jgi:hypothetical protein